jgi:hypothetical protein
MLEDTKSLEQPANIIDEEDKEILPPHMKSERGQKVGQTENNLMQNDDGDKVEFQ